MFAASDYRLMWLRRLDALWLARPDPTSLYGADGLLAEMRAAIGEGSFDAAAANAALEGLIGVGEVLAVEVGEAELAVRITRSGQARLARLEARPS